MKWKVAQKMDRTAHTLQKLIVEAFGGHFPAAKVLSVIEYRDCMSTHYATIRRSIPVSGHPSLYLCPSAGMHSASFLLLMSLDNLSATSWCKTFKHEVREMESARIKILLVRKIREEHSLLINNQTSFISTTVLMD